MKTKAEAKQKFGTHRKTQLAENYILSRWLKYLLRFVGKKMQNCKICQGLKYFVIRFDSFNLLGGSSKLFSSFIEVTHWTRVRNMFSDIMFYKSFYGKKLCQGFSRMIHHNTDSICDMDFCLPLILEIWIWHFRNIFWSAFWSLQNMRIIYILYGSLPGGQLKLARPKYPQIFPPQCGEKSNFQWNEELSLFVFLNYFDRMRFH